MTVAPLTTSTAITTSNRVGIPYHVGVFSEEKSSLNLFLTVSLACGNRSVGPLHKSLVYSCESITCYI